MVVAAAGSRRPCTNTSCFPPLSVMGSWVPLSVSSRRRSLLVGIGFYTTTTGCSRVGRGGGSYTGGGAAVGSSVLLLPPSRSSSARRSSPCRPVGCALMLCFLPSR